MPSLTQLEYALSVEKHRHFGRAAEACHVSQPTLSQQLSKLEEEVGLMLFDRIQKPIIPTEEGKRFLEQARVVVREHQKLLYLSKQAKDGEIAGEFKLAIIPTIASYLVPYFVRQFSRTYPKVDLFIEEMKTDTILSELRNDKLDGAILATPIEGHSFKVHPLYYEPFYLYLSEEHPLLKKKQLTQEDLDATQMWLLQDGHCFKNQVLSFCSLPPSQDSVLPNVRFQSGSLDTIKRLVQANKGYTLMPALMVETLDKGEVERHVRPFKAPIPTREVSFLYRRDHWKLDIIRAIETVVEQTLPESLSRTRGKHHTVLEVC